MPTRTILASFHTRYEAEEAGRQSRALGAEVAEVDELHPYAGVRPQRDSFLVGGDIPSLASITLDTVGQGRDANVLMAADPSASGMNDGQGNVTGRNYLLTVIAQEPLVDKVVQSIKRNNGFT